MTVKTTVLFRHRWNTPKLNSERRLEPVLIPQWPLMALASLNRSRRAESASELWSSGIGIIKFPSQRVSATTSLARRHLPRHKGCRL